MSTSMRNKHVYVCSSLPKLRFRITVNGVDVQIQFNKGSYRTDDDAIAAEIERCIALPEGVLAPLINKVDYAAADALAQRIGNEMRQVVVKGGTHSDAIHAAMRLGAEGSAALRAEAAPNQGGNPEVMQELAQQMQARTFVPTERAATPAAAAAATPNLHIGIAR